MSFSTSSSTKSLDRWCRSLLVLPSNTDEIQPHHVVVLSYGLFTIISTLSIYKNYIKPFWNEVSRRSLCQLSDLSEKIGLPLVHAGFVPDVLIRWGIRLQLRAHLAQLSSEPCVEELETKMNIVNELQCMPIAIDTDTANEQHYEVPAKFYDLCLVSMFLLLITLLLLLDFLSIQGTAVLRLVAFDVFSSEFYLNSIHYYFLQQGSEKEVQ